MSGNIKQLKAKFQSVVKSENPMLVKIESDITAKVPKDKLELFYRTIIAAETMLFDPKTHSNMELIKNPKSRDNPVETIASGVAGLMNLLYVQSRRTLPTEVVIYGGIVIACVVWDFAERGLNIPISPKIIAQTTQLMCEKLFKSLGVSPEQLRDAIISGKKEINDYYAQQAHLEKKMPIKARGK